MIKKFIKCLMLNRFTIDYVNFFFQGILKVKNILSPAVTHQGKFFRTFKDDLFICSYPKSGTLWVSLITAILLKKTNDINLLNIDNITPDIYTNKESKFINAKRPRMFKTHESFDPRFKRVIYVVRDPRDVIVSLYFFLIKIGKINKNYSKRKFVKEFLNGTYDIDFGSWEQNIGSWFGGKKENIIFVRYEDLKKNYSKEIKRICVFLKIKPKKTLIKKVVNKTQFETLQKQEEKYDLKWSVNSKKNNLKYFRSGKINQWKKFLSTGENKIIKNKWKFYMKLFKYY
tara:strand:- start:119 stop:976 length:858 start_codon:yes stop_codon:yes gene_type:complete